MLDDKPHNHERNIYRWLHCHFSPDNILRTIWKYSIHSFPLTELQAICVTERKPQAITKIGPLLAHVPFSSWQWVSRKAQSVPHGISRFWPRYCEKNGKHRIHLFGTYVPVYKRISGILGNSMRFALVIERCQPVENSGAHKHEPETGSVVPQRREVLELVLSDAVLFQVQDGREEGIFVCGHCRQTGQQAATENGEQIHWFAVLACNR